MRYSVMISEKIVLIGYWIAIFLLLFPSFTILPTPFVTLYSHHLSIITVPLLLFYKIITSSIRNEKILIDKNLTLLILFFFLIQSISLTQSAFITESLTFYKNVSFGILLYLS